VVKELDAQRLRKVASGDRLAKTVFTYFTKFRERGGKRTDIWRLRQYIQDDMDVTASEIQMRELFRVFETLGLGKLLLANKPGAHDRFHWHYDLVTVSATALGQVQAPSPIAKAPGTADGPQTFIFSVKAGLVRVQLPGALSQGEKTKLAEAILAL